MITRSIYIGSPSYLQLKDEQMVISCPVSKDVKGRIPTEDLGLIMIDHYQVTITHQLIQKLMNHKVVVISCDDTHMPHGMMLPIYGHSEYSERVKDQIEASEPLKKQLWKQTVEAKIANQKAVLTKLGRYSDPMTTYLQEVRSGDQSNMEGIAAQHYWKHLISLDFIRARHGASPNHLFNFGYIVLRSIVARAIVETGLLPVMGIFHKNKYNPYCLADDLMEPYRPVVDQLVMEWLEQGPAEELTKDFKAHILRMATVDLSIDNKTRPLMVAVKTSAVSLWKCYSGEKRQIHYPSLL
jgi:CRISPR-associated protein Cas1